MFYCLYYFYLRILKKAAYFINALLYIIKDYIPYLKD